MADVKIKADIDGFIADLARAKAAFETFRKSVETPMSIRGGGGGGNGTPGSGPNVSVGGGGFTMQGPSPVSGPHVSSHPSAGGGLSAALGAYTGSQAAGMSSLAGQPIVNLIRNVNTQGAISYNPPAGAPPPQLMGSFAQRIEPYMPGLAHALGPKGPQTGMMGALNRNIGGIAGRFGMNTARGAYGGGFALLGAAAIHTAAAGARFNAASMLAGGDMGAQSSAELAYMQDRASFIPGLNTASEGFRYMTGMDTAASIAAQNTRTGEDVAYNNSNVALQRRNTSMKVGNAIAGYGANGYGGSVLAVDMANKTAKSLEKDRHDIQREELKKTEMSEQAAMDQALEELGRNWGMAGNEQGSKLKSRQAEILKLNKQQVYGREDEAFNNFNTISDEAAAINKANLASMNSYNLDVNRAGLTEKRMQNSYRSGAGAAMGIGGVAQANFDLYTRGTRSEEDRANAKMSTMQSVEDLKAIQRIQTDRILGGSAIESSAYISAQGSVDPRVESSADILKETNNQLIKIYDLLDQLRQGK